MMKQLYIILVTACISIGNSGIAHATLMSFPTNTVDFNNLKIGDTSSLFTYEYTHNIGILDPEALNIVSANLALTHYGNNNNDNGEIWFSYTEGNITIGQLSTSNGSTWVTDTWSLSQDILTAMTSTNPWSLTVKLTENTNGNDSIHLDKSVLSGMYNSVEESLGGNVTLGQISVPEPSVLSLLGIGLFGLLARRKIKI